MKLKYVALIFTILMLFSLIFTISSFNASSYKEIDILEVNKNVKEIKEKINTTNTFELEDEYNCQILYLNNEYYSSILNNAYKNNSVIIDYVENNEIIGKFIFDNQKEIYIKAQQNTKIKIYFVLGLSSLFVYALLILLYSMYVRPFNKLEKFANSIAKGDLDSPLLVSKKDYFGAFSEAFDCMREALKKAREGEYQANKSKKELIAGLSHDIKTPIATIDAICELLSLKITDKEILEKIGIIDAKTKIIDTLMSNMFNATLEELEVLKVTPSLEQTTIIKPMFMEINYYDKIVFLNDAPEYLVYMDKLRLIQAIDNIINNSYKYANTDIHVSFKNNDEGLNIIVRDFGKGCDEEDLALATEKFHRGKNTSTEAGSGLGLYLAKLFLKEMKGDLLVENDNGFIVTLFLKKV